MENFKDIEVSKRNWRVGKFDAFTGAKVVKKLLPIASAFLSSESVNLDDLKDLKTNIPLVINALTDLKDEDFEYIQKACLKITCEKLPAGVTPVLNDNGSYGVLNIEYDTMLVLALTVHALMFNVTGFFVDTPLGSLAGGIMSTFQQNLQT